MTRLRPHFPGHEPGPSDDLSIDQTVRCRTSAASLCNPEPTADFTLSDVKHIHISLKTNICLVRCAHDDEHKMRFSAAC
jgi:hypothetical protein